LTDYSFVLRRETFDFGMFAFTVGSAGLRNFSCVKIFNGVNFFITINASTH